MSHLSYAGQSEVDYCIECTVKHGQTAKVLMKEALQRAEANGPQSEGVKEKVKGVVEELMGIEDDTKTVTDNQKVIGLNTMARTLWKEIYASEAEIGKASIGKLREINVAIGRLVDKTYTVREEIGGPYPLKEEREAIGIIKKARVMIEEASKMLECKVCKDHLGIISEAMGGEAELLRLGTEYVEKRMPGSLPELEKLTKKLAIEIAQGQKLVGHSSTQRQSSIFDGIMELVPKPIEILPQILPTPIEVFKDLRPPLPHEILLGGA